MIYTQLNRQTTLTNAFTTVPMDQLQLQLLFWYRSWYSMHKILLLLDNFTSITGSNFGAVRF